MNTKTNFIITINEKADFSKLQKGLWIVIINAARVPPHIGLLFNGSYSSLNIKGIEKDIDVNVLLRTIEMQGVKSVFIKVAQHPVFSIDFLREHFLHEVEKYEKVSAENTCFKPVRTFFQENYVLWNNEMEYLYQLFPALYANSMIDYAIGLNIAEVLEGDKFVLKAYTSKDIEDKLNDIKRLQLSND